MSEVRIECPIWEAIMADPQLAAARRKLSFHEIRLIINHARLRNGSKPEPPPPPLWGAIGMSNQEQPTMDELIEKLERFLSMPEWPRFYMDKRDAAMCAAALRAQAQRREG